ncbi:MAG: hypothetical protein WBY44_36030 [Bryobacteraceae bacterium]
MMNDCPIDISKMMPVESIQGEDAEDTNLLKQMAAEARNFVSSQKWCDHIDGLHLAYGVGGVVGVFLVQITPRSDNVDNCLWVIVGDLPPAYIVTEDNPTAAEALDSYCSEMEAWVEAANEGASVDELIPVNVPPTPEHAEQLGGRIAYIRSKILPLAEAE